MRLQLGSLDVGTGVANSYVDQGFSTLYNYASGSYHLAEELIGQLKEFNVAPVNFNVSYTIPTFTETFTKPARPEDPVLPSLTVDAPTPPALTSVDFILPGGQPSFTKDAPLMDFTGKPNALTEDAPETVVSLTDIALPSVPDISLPSIPALETLTIPTLPSYTIPTFGYTMPEPMDLMAPDGTLAWNESEYITDLTTKISSRLSVFMDGGTALPANVEQALWDRERVREDRVAAKTAQGVYEEFSARGFSLPQGVMAQRLAEIAQANQDKAVTLGRDIAIKQAELEQANMQFAISQGIAYENMMGSFAMQIAQRRFEAAKTTVELAIQVFNARVALYNSQLQAYQTAATVYSELVKAELLKLEAYKAEIEGQKVLGEINLQKVEIYKATLQGLMTNVELYKGQLEGVRTQVEVDRSRIEAAKLLVETYKTKVEAKSAEYQAWSTSIEAESKKMQGFQVEAQAFASRMQGWQAGVEAYVSKAKIENEINSQRVEQFRAEIEAYKADVQAVVAQIQAATSVYDGQAKVFAAEGSIEEARVRSAQIVWDAIVKNTAAQAELNMKAADLNINQLQRNAQLNQAAIEGATRAASQLASASLAGINVSAGLNTGFNISHSANISETADVTPVVAS
jgi:hypothetical protein